MNIIKRQFKLCKTFYTFRAIGFHILFAIGVLPNTWIIALLVLLVSQILLFVWPNYKKMYGITFRGHKNLWRNEILFHWLPVFIVPYGVTGESIGVLIISLCVYLWYYNKEYIKRIYITHHNEVINEIIYS